jgi:predicted dehydrogenase
VLIDTGSHTLDQVVWWFGEPSDVEYFDDADGGVEANCHARMRWRSGFEGEVELTRTRVLPNNFTLETDKGRLTLAVSGGGLKGSLGMLDYRSARFGRPPFRANDAFDQFRNQLVQFQGHVRGERANVVSGEDAARSVALIERCYAVRRRLELPWIYYTSGNHA